MQFRSSFLAIAVCVSYMLSSSVAENHSLTMTDSIKAESPQAAVTREQALEAVQDIERPNGVTLTGSVEPLKATDNDEQFGLGMYGGVGAWRFGYNCGGLGGWAYPLGYWDMFGAGLYGGGCGLGLAYGGLFYC